jgi:hypothetical protein
VRSAPLAGSLVATAVRSAGHGAFAANDLGSTVATNVGRKTKTAAKPCDAGGFRSVRFRTRSAKPLLTQARARKPGMVSDGPRNGNAWACHAC